MGRWLVILSLAIMQCSDAAVASSKSSDMPLWKRLLSAFTPAPLRREQPAEAFAMAGPREPAGAPQADRQPVAQSQPEEAAAGPDVQEPVAGWKRFKLITEWPAQAPVVGPQARQLGAGPQAKGPVVGLDAQEPVVGWQTQEPARSNAAGCNGGKRIISAFYAQGRRTASGQPFDPHAMAAAHRTLPFGTRLTVTNPRTGKSVTVVVNDRGPFVSGVSLDLTLGAAKAIGMRGTGTVCIW
jgi:rare lipoprotein A